MPILRITEEMVEAGVVAYQEHCPDTCSGDIFDKPMIREVLERAFRVAQSDGEACGHAFEQPQRDL
jgi:hypothetical protein